MKINVPLRRKDTEIETNQCVVEKTVELSADWFDHFSQNLLNDYDFILENADRMYQEQNGINHCLLVLGEGRDDGILIESEGSSYARYSAFVPKKIRIPLWIYPSTEEKLQKNYEADNCKSPSEFIEKAILFYCGYLASEEYKQYLPNVVVSTMQGSLDAFEDRMATLLFKIAVELCMMLHVTAATNEIDTDTLSRLRGLCVKTISMVRIPPLKCRKYLFHVA